MVQGERPDDRLEAQDLPAGVDRSVQQHQEIHVAPFALISPGVGAVEQEIAEAVSVEFFQTLAERGDDCGEVWRQAIHGIPIVPYSFPSPFGSESFGMPPGNRWKRR